jgi:hypothetical protein
MKISMTKRLGTSPQTALGFLNPFGYRRYFALLFGKYAQQLVTVAVISLS